MRLTDSNIVAYDNTFNGFDIERFPELETDMDKSPQYLLFHIRMIKYKKHTMNLCTYIDPFEDENDSIPLYAITAAKLAELYRMAKIGYGGLKKNKYDYFTHCANIYLYSLKNYISGGINGFNIEEWECVGGRCRIIDGKEHTNQLMKFLVTKNIEHSINEIFKNELRKAFGLQ